MPEAMVLATMGLALHSLCARRLNGSIVEQACVVAGVPSACCCWLSTHGLEAQIQEGWLPSHH
eukprot:1005903-Amphidinium_carterae.1